MEVGEGGDGDGGAGGDEHEVGREQLPLQVPELVPRQIPFQHKQTTIHPIESNSRIRFEVISDLKQSGFLELGEKIKNSPRFLGVVGLLEHDDAADEGGPEGGAPWGGEAEEVGHLGGRGGAAAGAGAGAGAEEDVGGEDDARREEADRRQEPRRPPHHSLSISISTVSRRRRRRGGSGGRRRGGGVEMEGGRR